MVKTTIFRGETPPEVPGDRPRGRIASSVSAEVRGRRLRSGGFGPWGGATLGQWEIPLALKNRLTIYRCILDTW